MNKIAQKPKFSAAIQTSGYQKLINSTLKDPKRANNFIANISSVVATNPLLQECDAGTILSAAFLAESLNLSMSPQLGQCYLVPYETALKDRDGKTAWIFDENGQHVKDASGHWMKHTVKKAQFQMGYKGYIQLAIRSGQYKKLNVFAVKEGELIKWDALNEEIEIQTIEDEIERENTPAIGYYAMFEYLNGFKKALYWSKKKMISHADKYSPAFKAADYERYVNGEIPDKDMWKYSNHWYKDFDAMANKTMLRQLISKWGIMSTEMQTVFERDMAVIEEDGTYAYVETQDEQEEFGQESFPENEKTAEQNTEGTEIVQQTESDIEEVSFDDL